MFSRQRIKGLIKKEFIQLKRDRPTLVMIVMIPVVQLLLFGYAVNTDPKYLPASVILRDDTFLTRSIVSALERSEYFRIAGAVFSDNAGDARLRSGKDMFVITFPDGFTADVVRGKAPSVLIEADASDPTSVSGALGALQGIAESVIAKELKGPLADLAAVRPPFSFTVQKKYNPEGFTRYNIVPGLIGMVLIFTGVMMTAMALTRERERGTMENLLSMPARPFEIMVGKICPFIFIGFFQSGVILFLARFLFGIPVLGSGGVLAAALLLFITCNLLLGYLISTAAKNQTQALQMSIFVLLPSLMLTGFMFPFYGMPEWAQYLGSCIPLTYFLRIVRAVMLKGAGFADVAQNFWSLTAFVAIITLITMKAYKKTLD